MSTDTEHVFTPLATDITPGNLDFRALFESAPGLYLVLDSDLRIVAASHAYTRATMTEREKILGRNIFDVFPDSPDDPDANGVHNLSASLQQVLRTRTPNTMAVQKYDIRKPETEGGGFEVRYWSPLNSPVLRDDGSLAYIIHRVEDVTDFIRLKQKDIEQNESTRELRGRMEHMEAEIYLRAREVTEANETLRNSEENLSVTLNSIGDAVLVTDAKGCVTRLNPIAEQLTGWKQSEALGHPVENIFHLVNQQTRQPIVIPIIESLKKGSIQHLAHHILLIAHDGSECSISISCAPIRNSASEMIGAVLIFRDVTEVNAIQIAYQQAKEKAELANHSKDTFLATISHEIRTPLSAVSSMLELIDMTSLDSDQKEMVKIARDAGRSLLRILSDILDWSKIEAGKLALSPQAVSLPQLMEDVVKTYSSLANEKRLELYKQVDTHLSAAHIVDPLRLSQVLNNFVSNALKFTREGEVELRAKLIDRQNGAERIRLSVRDTGIGLNLEQQSNLFRNYSQASADTARMYGGTGLGLAISRRLADLMDGVIELESTQGRGSIFSITLTLPTTDLISVQVSTTTANTPSVQPIVKGISNAPIVLVVDDHAINLGLLIRQIELLGLHVNGAEDGEAALKLWRNRHFDLIITDCHMPRMDGYQLAKTIRDMEPRGKKRIPIIACTANALGEENERCYAAGMNEVIIKPVNLLGLRETLLRWLPQINTDETSSSGVEINHDNIPIDYMCLRNTVPDRSGQISLLNKFLIHERTDFNKLTDALDRDNLADVLNLAHRIKGASQMVGAKEMTSIYSAIEQSAKKGDLETIHMNIRLLVTATRRFEKHLLLFSGEESNIQSKESK